MIFLPIFLMLTPLHVLPFGKKSCGQLILLKWVIDGNLEMVPEFSFGRISGLVIVV
jgi:hypothetical protein